MTAGVFQRVHFAVQDGAAILHAAVVATTDDLVAVHDHRADGDATFRQPLAGFLDRGLKKWISGCHGLLRKPYQIARIAKIAKIAEI